MAASKPKFWLWLSVVVCLISFVTVWIYFNRMSSAARDWDQRNFDSYILMIGSIAGLVGVLLSTGFRKNTKTTRADVLFGVYFISGLIVTALSLFLSWSMLMLNQHGI